MATHSEPIWRERSNFILAAQIPDGQDREQLWGRQVAPLRFELCCIPFFLYDVALGDIVETDSSYIMQRVVQSSGRYVFRAYFGGTPGPPKGMVEQLTDLGALLEWSSKDMLALDATDAAHAQVVADFLHDAANRGQLMYETGRS